MVESEGSHRPFSHSLIIFLDRAGSSFDPSAAIVNGAAWRAARILSPIRILRLIDQLYAIGRFPIASITLIVTVKIIVRIPSDAIGVAVVVNRCRQVACFTGSRVLMLRWILGKIRLLREGQALAIESDCAEFCGGCQLRRHENQSTRAL